MQEICSIHRQTEISSANQNEKDIKILTKRTRIERESKGIQIAIKENQLTKTKKIKIKGKQLINKSKPFDYLFTLYSTSSHPLENKKKRE